MEQIRQDHLTLRALLGELDAMLVEEGSRSLEPLMRTLATLTERLADHFQHEEHSDLYVGVPKRIPQLAPALAELRVEHGTILETLIDARGAAERLRAARGEVADQVSKLVETLRKHERTEAELMARAFAAE